MNKWVGEAEQNVSLPDLAAPALRLAPNLEGHGLSTDVALDSLTERLDGLIQGLGRKQAASWVCGTYSLSHKFRSSPPICGTWSGGFRSTSHDGQIWA